MYTLTHRRIQMSTYIHTFMHSHCLHIDVFERTHPHVNMHAHMHIYVCTDTHSLSLFLTHTLSLSLSLHTHICTHTQQQHPSAEPHAPYPLYVTQQAVCGGLQL